MYAISGITSTIAGEFIALLPKLASWTSASRPWDLPLDAHRYLVLNGLLFGKRRSEQSAEEQERSIEANFLCVAGACRAIFEVNEAARVVVLGSESAYRGSYDESYAYAKALLHLFVEELPLSPGQQLVAISPNIISDSRMTLARTDTERLLERKQAIPKRRFVTAREVARLAYFLLAEDEGFITGTVIRMHGGER